VQNKQKGAPSSARREKNEGCKIVLFAIGITREVPEQAVKSFAKEAKIAPNNKYIKK